VSRIFASAAPPIIAPDPYGIDLPTFVELIAADHSVEEVRKSIGADQLFYGTIEDLRAAIRYGNSHIKRFSEGCFTGKYPTPDVSLKMLRKLGDYRNSCRSCDPDPESMHEYEPSEQPALNIL
jgi:amidophosphoribosyltransferase